MSNFAMTLTMMQILTPYNLGGEIAVSLERNSTHVCAAIVDSFRC